MQISKPQKGAPKKDSLGGYPLAAITQALLEASAGIGAAAALKTQSAKDVKNIGGRISQRVEKKPMKSRLGVQARLGMVAPSEVCLGPILCKEASNLIILLLR